MNIIFHHPLPLDPNAQSASGIRPLQMLQAFEDLGCHVDVVSGYSRDRKKAIASIKKQIAQGKKYAFMYAESSTAPTALTDRHHLPLHPWMDAGFFWFCKNNGIPIGLFYRDIYWRFSNYSANLNTIKMIGAKLAYNFDLMVYNRTLKKLYLPSLEMKRHVPLVDSRVFAALPPGHSQSGLSKPKNDSAALRVFYVGGMSSHYQMHELFKAISSMPEVDLTVCTRASEWKAVQSDYPLLTPNIKIIHESGKAMERVLMDCDIASLFVLPQDYWNFAVPLKLFDYIGFEKPVLASKKTWAGDFVQKNNIGWVLEYNETALINFLQDLIKNKSKLSIFHENLRTVAKQNSWKARAQQVIQDLLEL